MGSEMCIRDSSSNPRTLLLLRLLCRSSVTSGIAIILALVKWALGVMQIIERLLRDERSRRQRLFVGSRTRSLGCSQSYISRLRSTTNL